MSDLPDPMSPPDCDLRGAEFMPMFGQRLFGSAFYSHALTKPRGGIAALKLWWEAWQQCPAGSLPADDMTLCRLADFGTDLRAWGRVKDVALHGFILCSDGRLYHPLLCEFAMHVHQKRVSDRKRQANWRAAKGTGRDADVTRDTTVTRQGHDGDVTALSKGKESKERNPPGPPLGKGGRRRRDKSLNGWVAYRTEEEELADAAARATAH